MYFEDTPHYLVALNLLNDIYETKWDKYHLIFKSLTAMNSFDAKLEEAKNILESLNDNDANIETYIDALPDKKKNFINRKYQNAQGKRNLIRKTIEYIEEIIANFPEIEVNKLQEEARTKGFINPHNDVNKNKINELLATEFGLGTISEDNKITTTDKVSQYLLGKLLNVDIDNTDPVREEIERLGRQYVSNWTRWNDRGKEKLNLAIMQKISEIARGNNLGGNGSINFNGPVGGHFRQQDDRIFAIVDTASRQIELRGVGPHTESDNKTYSVTLPDGRNPTINIGKTTSKELKKWDYID